MKFEGKELTKMDEIFKEALEIAKTGDRGKCDEFLLTYAGWIKEENPEVKNCLGIAKSNLGYWAGYYGIETSRKIEEAYEATHPIFGTAEEMEKMTAEDFYRKGKERRTNGR